MWRILWQKPITTMTETEYLRDRLQGYQRAEEERQEIYESKLERREEKRRREMRQPKDWPDAFLKSAELLAREIRICSDGDADDSFFTEQLVQVVFARNAYNREMQAAQAEIDAIMARVRNATAQALEAKYGAEAADFAQALRDNDPKYLTNW